MWVLDAILWGALATTAMTAVELPIVLRRGWVAVFDYELNQSTAARLVGGDAERHLPIGLALHYSHGIGGALALGAALAWTAFNPWFILAVFVTAMTTGGLVLYRLVLDQWPAPATYGWSRHGFRVATHVLYAGSLAWGLGIL